MKCDNCCNEEGIWLRENLGLLTKFLSESGKESGTICTKTLELVILNTKN
jgi:hypothetical protein